MSEELKKYVEEALYKWIKKQIEEGNFRANLRIEIDNPVEIRGMKGRILGEIVLSGETVNNVNSYPVGLPKKSEESKKDDPSKVSQEDMSLAEVDRLLKSLGV